MKIVHPKTHKNIPSSIQTNPEMHIDPTSQVSESFSLNIVSITKNFPPFLIIRIIYKLMQHFSLD